MANTAPLELIDIPSRYKHITPVPRMPNFAAWIDGVDLSKPMSDPVKQELRQALFDFEVIFFRPQEITPAQHLALGEVFGSVSPGSFFEQRKDTPGVELIVSDKDTPPQIDHWHTDISWKPDPPLGTAIQITDTPKAGGNTCWISTSKAYDWLSPGMQQYLEGLTAIHTWEQSAFREMLGEMGEDQLIAAIKAHKPVEHPVIRLNPDSGRKCVFVNSDFTRRICNLDQHEGEGMLRFLLDWLKRPEFMVHHQWEAGGIAIWDNRSTQHYAVADYWPEYRVNQRVTFNSPVEVEAKQPDAVLAK